jgi:SAM-dependent methyltransferase
MADYDGTDLQEKTHTRGEIPPITSDSLGEFWRAHDQRWSAVDRQDDPAGLANVCHAGAPPWVNRYAAACQERVFHRLVSHIHRTERGQRALDIGCGAGRWSRKLDAAGYEVVGVDLQPGLLESNRTEIPGVRFVYSSIQDFRDEPFDLVTSVTVIQHNPHDEQVGIVRRIRELVRTGGNALIMENCVDILPHVFARDERGWRELFMSSGFACLRSLRYDYRFAQRLGRGLAVPAAASSGDGSPRQRVRAAPSGVKRALVALDEYLEAPLVGFRVRGATHCAFLFTAV